MKEIDRIKDKYGTCGGWTVPEGFFENFRQEMLEKLPEPKRAPVVRELSKWQRVKPYIYMAAMFAGIWLMMKVFHNVSTPDSLNLDNPPAQIAMAMQSSDVSGEPYFALPSLPDIETEEDVLGSYSTFDEFEKDFNSEQ